jgi:hypothetical protein
VTENKQERRLEMIENKTTETHGAIFPIPDLFKDRLFDGKHNVFIKYLPHNSTKLIAGKKILFYASGVVKALVGEGEIEKIEFLLPQEVIKLHGKELFLSESEFNAYTRSSASRARSKKVLTLVLKKLRKYSKPARLNKPMTMAGQYINAEEYNSLVKGKPKLRTH